MSSTLIPLPANHEDWIQTLWLAQVVGKFTLNERDYKTYWPLVDGFWSHRKTENHLHGKFKTHYYACQLGPKRVSSKAEPYPTETKSGKKHVTSCSLPGTCPVKIKIIEPIQFGTDDQKLWTISQVLGCNDTGFKFHDHDINASWKAKRSSFLTNIIKDELAKGYTPSQVKDRLRGVGRVAGYERLESIGGAFMKR
ncbi:uncharacterized protein H6S33_008859 [Morchella sextelata]|uniref:uncharacterized protein n=1 Tax=Morchella sextelata TaxID=1174677 RepID=UPI001D0431BF|nr:uncharacterized protein H6S33_008859 [Morchella sextelata]KAH0612479.1 hypothetical protein H6S33_008859 [Morchella sextelata]